jgi:hypothetical protein
MPLCSPPLQVRSLYITSTSTFSFSTKFQSIMQIAPDNHLSFHSAGSRLVFPNPSADQDETIQSSFAATSLRSAQSSINRPDSLASRFSQYSTSPINPSKPSASLGQLGLCRKRPADPWSASTRRKQASRGDTHTRAQPSTTAVIDRIMDPIMRARARARAVAELYSSDDGQTNSHDVETSATTISDERSSDTVGTTAPVKKHDSEQHQVEPTRPSSQRQEDSKYSIFPATQNKIPLSERERDATLRIDAHYKEYQEAMAKIDSGRNK